MTEKKSSTSNKRVGFTLIELLVAHQPSYAILAAMLLPALSQRQSASAGDLVGKNNLKQLGLAEQIYLGDNNGKMVGYPGNTLWVQGVATARLCQRGQRSHLPRDAGSNTFPRHPFDWGL